MPLALDLAIKARQLALSHPAPRLYRSICKEIPRVLTIYDIDMPVSDVKARLRELFAENAHVKDDRVVDMLIEKGYMDLEETLLQHKQRTHLMRTLGGYVDRSGADRKKLGLDATPEEIFARL